MSLHKFVKPNRHFKLNMNRIFISLTVTIGQKHQTSTVLSLCSRVLLHMLSSTHLTRSLIFVLKFEDLNCKLKRTSSVHGTLFNSGGSLFTHHRRYTVEYGTLLLFNIYTVTMKIVSVGFPTCMSLGHYCI